MNIPFIEKIRSDIPNQLLEKIPAKFACRYKVLPIKEENGTITVVISEPFDIHIIDDIRLMLNCRIKVFKSSEKEVQKALRKYYGIGAETIEQMADNERIAKEQYKVPEKDKVSPESVSEDASIAKLVNQIINDAFHNNATDIHFEPFEEDLIVRYRIDGVLHKISVPDIIKQFQNSIISRIKIMADMNIAEKRVPQDGRIKFRIGKEDIDLRVSTIPTLFGESIDLRILPRSHMMLGLEQLGLDEEYLKKIELLIKRPHGIILVTGPTGHGKTTTLYACLSKINSVDKKIITAEDPIEYQLKGVNQIQVHPKIGLTFANGLRSILRHDPDVIMVGEIRDFETSEIAIRSSLTGHLVFSTLHTNDASGAITRLIDMGIEPYLISSSIEAVLAQRLIRLLCKNCKKKYKPDKNILEKMGIDSKYSGPFYNVGPGCEECRNTGYKGRTGIFELLILDENLRNLILDRTSTNIIKQKAIASGMKTLRNNGWTKVIKGLTTVEEVMRVTQEEDMV
ncbi:MAG: type II secretion system ATPase GspE [Elusimicrobia bacterium]|nr:type II secretion system ATPase GspE [Elusimicrobiota bacterium]